MMATRVATGEVAIPTMTRSELLTWQDALFEALGELLELRDRTRDSEAASRAERAAAFLRPLSSSIEQARWNSVDPRQRSGGRRGEVR